MAKTVILNRKANEAVSKFKLLSAYGGPGSVVHTAYGSIIISCIEEWGFLNTLLELHQQAIELREPEDEYVSKHSGLQDVFLSNDERLLDQLKRVKRIENLKYLVLIPDIELHDHFNTIIDNKVTLAINSEFMPKGFFDRNNRFKSYHEWYRAWPKAESEFFPPKYTQKANSNFNDGTYDRAFLLKQDNIVLICKNGHMSDFPWSKFLRWRIEHPHDLNKEVDLFSAQPCCSKADIQINETTANASGFDGKWLKCNNPGCECAKGTSLKGIMSLKIVCPGHKPWESETGEANSYFGRNEVRNRSPRTEPCGRRDLKVALTTGNNLYFSRVLTSIYMPFELFLHPDEIKVKKLKADLEIAKAQNDFEKCILLNKGIKNIEADMVVTPQDENISDHERDQRFRFQEYQALVNRPIGEINVHKKDLTVSDVTANLHQKLTPFFNRILRVDRLKITSAQLDFSRIEPYEGGSSDIENRPIFRSRPETVLVYPVVENYGEGIFFSFDHEMIDSYRSDQRRLINLIKKPRNNFADGAVMAASAGGWQLYMVHTFCHLIMRELEFRCGYPTASLSERLFVSNDPETKMYGCLIYTAEGAEGSMGGLIAQTRSKNLNDLINSALLRSTICHSDPLCWQSEGQGLFELNLASCFSCGLVSETSCEHRNIYLDRRMLIDENIGFFKTVIAELK